MGQKGTMRQGSDYLAVSYIKGNFLEESNKITKVKSLALDSCLEDSLPF